MSYKLVSKFKPMGDQPEAIKELVKGIHEGKKTQVLLGGTGTGKTFTFANVIAQVNKPTLVLSHNNSFQKTVSNTLFQTSISISQKPIFLRVIHILIKNHKQMKK